LLITIQIFNLLKNKETFLAVHNTKTRFIRFRKLNSENLIWYSGELHNDGMSYEHITDALFCKTKDKLNLNVFRHLISRVGFRL
jgi:hypothetical protein